MKQYIYRRDDGMELRRNRRSLWLPLRGYRLVEVVEYKTHKKAG
ncbi:hypothetical protein CathTA2_2443 [Caldalkalibacillus thermarum TA2.A1]|uniref:Uncharacterized protein n=1 Tax=Caldalkalibacillus thermarum (strain TA2.A1) TaxID=986075 RepID=F5L9D8_CALTT|nr:hypothetical protein [Caldalkalibacillus thermarum]EGL82080.1 hypothetical protein CathTA2_2443 [Caldalkalibacillus thermarum TA2.A1]